MEMESCKPGYEEAKFIDIEVKQKTSNKTSFKGNRNPKSEKLKNLIIRVIKSRKFKSSSKSASLAKIRVWIAGVITLVLILWVCVMQRTNLQETIAQGTRKYVSSLVSPRIRTYENRGYLMVSTNGGLNQMRSGISDMVTIARFLNVTLVVPELDNTSFWSDQSKFSDIFDVDYFIESLRAEVRILKELPKRQKQRLKTMPLYSIPPVSWSNMSYYYEKILPQFKKNEIAHFRKTDARLANNDLPENVQKLRCRVNYEALRFTRAIHDTSKKIVNILRKKGQFMVLHLRYEMDMLAFSGCTEGCNEKEIEELTNMRYAYPWWKEKEIDPVKKREAGLCPLTPEETALTLKGLGIDQNMEIYIAAGNIYGGERRMAGLRSLFPYLVKKETLLPTSELQPFKNHSNQMAALDYLVSLEADVFVPTYGGNMAKVVEGHRRYLGYKVTINLDKIIIVDLIDSYKNGTINWEEFSNLVKSTHANKMGSPVHRLKIPGKAKEEDYFYTNPEECLPPS